ncbi:MAG: M48 family metalloprotease [Chlorobi bacterium]|nr:M48 family metalloprotease [Chlorobiota bacterium]
MRKSVFIAFVFTFQILFVSAQDFSYDKKMGAEAAKQVETMMDIYPDSALREYVADVGNRLASVLGKAPVDFRFHLIDSPDPNAFALPGGYIYITRGLLVLVNDEAELAGVMGHEMIHVTKRHSVKQQQKGILPAILQIPGAIIGMASPELGKVINTPINFGSQVFLSSYSRSHEKEADRFGVKLASKAGYDPSKLAVILHSLSEDVERMTGEAEKKSYLASHPYTPKREAYLKDEIETLDWTPKKAIAQSKEDVYKKLEGMVFGQNPQQGIFDDSLFMHPDMDFAIIFPSIWQTTNVPVAVGATEKNGEAQIVLQLDNSGKEPDSLGLAFVDYLKKNNLKPKESKSVTINGNPAYFVSLQDDSGEKTIEVQTWWLKMNDLVFHMVGVGYPEHSKAINNTVHSIRKLTKEEKAGISSLKIHFAKANEGESLEDFSKRTNNNWDIETMVIMNNLEPGAKLTSGQLLKIAVEESYF